MTDVRIVDLQEQPTAVIRETVAMTALPSFFDRALGAVMAAVTAQGLQIVGEPFAMYHGMPGDSVDVEAGFPVNGSFEPAGDVLASLLPAGRAAEAMHVGPYEGLPTTYGEVLEHIAAEGLTPADDMWECYLSDPGAEPDPATWRTRIVWPVR